MLLSMFDLVLACTMVQLRAGAEGGEGAITAAMQGQNGRRGGVDGRQSR